MTTGDESCPRCGGGIEVMASGPVTCLSLRCAGHWGDYLGFERECVARALVGNAAGPKDEEYFLSDDEGSLSWELRELQSLIVLATLNEVRKMTIIARDGRKDMVRAGILEALEADAQVQVLDKMIKWLEDQIANYGEENGE